MTTGSALLGHPPNNQDDSYIVKGFYRSNGIPDIAWNETSIIPVFAPPGAPHDSHEKGLIVSCTLIITLLTLITGTRLSLRLFRKDLRWGADDWAIIVGFLGVVAWVGIALAAAVDGGAGKRLYDLTYEEFNTYMSMMWIGQVLFYPVTAMIKISIVLFNRRLTGLTSRTWMIIHNTFLVLLVIYAIITICINVYMCAPHPKNFEILYIGKMEKPPHWMKNVNAVVPTFCAIHIVFDFALLSVPLIVLWRMKMSASKKIRLCFLFSIGAVSTIGAVMRAIVQETKQTDITYQFPDFVRWSFVDIFFATTVASLPTLNNLVPKRWDYTRNSNSDHSAPKVISGSEKLDSKTTMGEPQVRRLGSDSTLQDEGGYRKQSASTGTGTQPDWEGYYPEIRVGV